MPTPPVLSPALPFRPFMASRDKASRSEITNNEKAKTDVKIETWFESSPTIGDSSAPSSLISSKESTPTDIVEVSAPKTISKRDLFMEAVSQGNESLAPKHQISEKEMDWLFNVIEIIQTRRLTFPYLIKKANVNKTH
jgi:hypothetical protein